jgi:predicted TIM-barrel fold metal-dependent hydrolase
MNVDFRFNKTAEQYDKAVRGVAFPKERKPQQPGDIKLPPNTVVVSADSHWSLRGDIFYERFPAHLKHKAPRFELDPEGVPLWLINGTTAVDEGSRRTLAAFEATQGCHSIAPRLRDMDAEGTHKEINFPNGILEFLAYPDLEVREWIFRIYNKHLSEMQAQAPGRFYGAALFNYWDMSRVRESVAEIKALGLKTLMLPQNPRGADLAQMNYVDPEMEPMWQALEESELPVCFHVGEFSKGGPGGRGITIMMNLGPFRKQFAELVFGGIFDRHPKLQVVFIEAEINWIPGALQTASMAYESFHHLLEPQIKHHPRHYWFNNCYAVFTHDPAGMRLLDMVGADRCMWSSDYPHVESTYGYSWDSIRTVLDAAASEDDARAMLGGTAMKLFKLD